MDRFTQGGMMRYTLTLKMMVLAVAGLLLIFLLGTILFFNAMPAEIRVTQPFQSDHRVTDPQFKLESGVFSGSPWVEGNDIEILSTGTDVFEAMLADIGSAEKSVTKETYLYWGEEIATPMAVALADAAHRGVKTHFMMDYVGSLNATTEQFDKMLEAGVEITRWRKPFWYQLARFNYRTHRKLMVMDGRIAYTGGVNTAEPWVPAVEDGGYKDYHYRITGPVVSLIQGMFSLNWVSSTGTLLAGKTYYTLPDTTGTISMQVTSSNPIEGRKNVRKMMLYAIASAENTIRFGTAYFFPDKVFIEALKDAASRNVQIRIIMPGEKIDKQYVRTATYTLLGDVVRSGIEIYEYQPSKYHAKMMIVDDYFVSIGSTNLDNRSFRLNDEANVNILDREFAQQLASLFDEDLEQSEQITLEKIEGRPVWNKIRGWAVSMAMGPYL